MRTPFTQTGTPSASPARHTSDAGGEARPSEPRINPNLIPDLAYQELAKRKLTEESCRKWQYGIADCSGQKVQVANYFSPDGKEVVRSRALGEGERSGGVKRPGRYS